jgi:ABC-type transport system involved in cytochrome c biogenesis ATPase subunit
LSQNLNPNIDELFEHFKYGSKNYVVFGKNGAGKTTLLRKICSDVINENSFVIPANRIVSIVDSDYHGINTGLDYNGILADNISMYYLKLI